MVRKSAPVQRQPLLAEDLDGRLGVDGQVGEDGDAGGGRGAAGRAVDPFVQVGHPAAAAHTDFDDPGLAAGVADADRDLVDELRGEIVDGGPGEEGQRGVAADEAGAGDDVHAGLGRQRLVVIDVPAVADPGGFDKGPPTVGGELAQLGDGLGISLLRGLPPSRVQLRPGHAIADVLVDGDDPQFLGGERAEHRVHSGHDITLRRSGR